VVDPSPTGKPEPFTWEGADAEVKQFGGMNVASMPMFLTILLTFVSAMAFSAAFARQRGWVLHTEKQKEVDHIDEEELEGLKM